MHLDSSDSEVECKHKSHRIGIEWEEVQYNNLEEKILPSKYFTQMSLSNNSNLSKMSKKSDVNAEILSQKYDKHIMLSTTLCPQCSGQSKAQPIQNNIGLVSSLYQSIQQVNLRQKLDRQRKKNKELEWRLHESEANYMKIFELNKNLKASNADIAELLKQEIKSRKIIVGRLEHSQEQLKTVKTVLTRKKDNSKTLLKKTTEESYELKRIKRQNKEYEAFIATLMQSVRILKGKKVKDLAHLWHQWQQIFEMASLNKYHIKSQAKFN